MVLIEFDYTMTPTVRRIHLFIGLNVVARRFSGTSALVGHVEECVGGWLRA